MGRGLGESSGALLAAGDFEGSLAALIGDAGSAVVQPQELLGGGVPRRSSYPKEGAHGRRSGVLGD
jgi:hypothetical protein